MKLNIDCVRDILLTMEKYEEYPYPVTFFIHEHANNYFTDFLSNYTCWTVGYHLRYCVKAGLLTNTSTDDFKFNCSMEPAGHDFLSNIKSEENWNRTKAVLSKLGDASLKVIAATAEGVTTAFMNKYLAATLSDI